MTKSRVTQGLIATVVLLGGAAFFVEKSAWRVLAHYRTARAADCACTVAGISSWQEWTVLGLAALFGVGILAGLWYVINTLRRTRRFISRIKRNAHEIVYAGAPVLQFRGEPCHAFTFGFWNPKIAVCAHCVETLPPHEFAAMVEHERHHAENRDPLKFFLVDALRYIFFFVPLIYTLRRWYHMVSELEADAQVNNREALGSALLKVAGVRAVESGLMASFASMLSIRIERIVNPTAVVSLPLNRAAMLGTLLFFTGMIGAMRHFPSTAIATSAPCLRQAMSCQTIAPVDTLGRAYYNGEQ